MITAQAIKSAMPKLNLSQPWSSVNILTGAVNLRKSTISLCAALSVTHKHGARFMAHMTSNP